MLGIAIAASMLMAGGGAHGGLGAGTGGGAGDQKSRAAALSAAERLKKWSDHRDPHENHGDGSKFYGKC